MDQTSCGFSLSSLRFHNRSNHAPEAIGYQKRTISIYYIGTDFNVHYESIVNVIYSKYNF